MKAVTLAIAAALVLFPVATLAAHDSGPEKFPAWYGGETRTVLMGPAGNSSNPNQLAIGCFRLGPVLSDRAANETAPIFYALFVPGASQMYCLDENGEPTLFHDMVLTRVPGDSGYSPVVRVHACAATEPYANEVIPYRSEADVLAGIDAGQLQCGFLAVTFGIVVD
jgi:hypothetical protein